MFGFCRFDKIIQKEIPADVVFEDDKVSIVGLLVMTVVSDDYLSDILLIVYAGSWISRYIPKGSHTHRDYS